MSTSCRLAAHSTSPALHHPLQSGTERDQLRQQLAQLDQDLSEEQVQQLQQEFADLQQRLERDLLQGFESGLADFDEEEEEDEEADEFGDNQLEATEDEQDQLATVRISLVLRLSR